MKIILPCIIALLVLDYIGQTDDVQALFEMRMISMLTFATIAYWIARLIDGRGTDATIPDQVTRYIAFPTGCTLGSFAAKIITVYVL
jgi:hypothetical protein